MTQQNFEIMDPVVDKICKSLETEPQNWAYGVWYLMAPHTLGSIQIYLGATNTFTQVRSSTHSSRDETVFSIEQGERIRDSYNKALSIVGSDTQQKLLKIISNSQELPSKNEPENNETTSFKFCNLGWYFFILSILFIIFKT